MSWNSGYVSEIDYTLGYYKQINPINSKFALNIAGIKTPTFETACELGFGLGITFNFNSIMPEIKWYGTDFNPNQARFCSELNEIGGLGSEVVDQDFKTFCSRPDLPDFDFIALHGIISWVSEENQKIITNFLRNKLKLGGVVYISYNAMPGWSQMLPFRKLMCDFLAYSTSLSDNIEKRIEVALKHTEILLNTNPLFIKANPGIKERFEEIKTQKKQYLAHEYFNLDWKPFAFTEMHNIMDSAKLTFGAPADLLDVVPSINFSTNQSEYLNSITNNIQKETAKDFITNCQFRQEYWVKGLRKLSTDEQERDILNTHVCLINNGEFPYSITRHARKANLSREIYEPILSIMSDRKPHKIGSIVDHLNKNLSLTWNTVTEAMCVLHGAGFITAVQNIETTSEMRSSANKINKHLIEASRAGYEITHLLSPRTASGILFDTVTQLFIDGFLNDKKSPKALSDFAWITLKAKGQRLLKDGKALSTESENLSELAKRAEEFLKHRVSMLQAYEIL